MARHIRHSKTDAHPSSVWMINGFSEDSLLRVFVSPILSGMVKPPPYHLSIILDEESEIVQALIRAFDYMRSPEKDFGVECITTKLLALLNQWSDGVDLTKLLEVTPFGSSFRVSGQSITELQIWMSPNFQLERRYLSVPRLECLWGSLELPPLIDLDQLEFVSRLHDSISLVKLPNGQHAIFKGVVRVVARMYHELRELLNMPPHPNIIARPMFLVMRKVRGMEHPAVCGFILQFHAGGSLLHALTNIPYRHELQLATKIKWIRQIISAFLHIHGPANGYYSDLRPDNIVLNSDNDIILVDFEQGGSPKRWLPPEAQPLHCDVNSELPQWCLSAVNPAYMPNSIHYSNPPFGYWKQFANASNREREEMECYTIAKVIWCIFEEQTNQLSSWDLTDEEGRLRRNDGVQLRHTVFPYFSKTPPTLRHWIWACTKHSREWGDERCRCTSIPEICGVSGARYHGGGMDSHPGPCIRNMHLALEGWIADQ
ncbi:hypothetical protein F5X98DRAFT_201118 [Xylaria grammica]|nr:hypothetical protein F5X98DRAFT_201118 [Xylaria grammica]